MDSAWPVWCRQVVPARPKVSSRQYLEEQIYPVLQPALSALDQCRCACGAPLSLGICATAPFHSPISRAKRSTPPHQAVCTAVPYPEHGSGLTATYMNVPHRHCCSGPTTPRAFSPAALRSRATWYGRHPCVPVTPYVPCAPSSERSLSVPMALVSVLAFGGSALSGECGTAHTELCRAPHRSRS